MPGKIPGLVFFISVFAALSFTVVSENGRAGYTGSLGEATCSTTNCHTGVQNNSMGGSVVISSPDLTDWEYTPGATYTIEVTVTQEGRSLFGIGFESIFPNGQNAGTLIPGADSQIKSKTVQGVSRKNVVHIMDGGATPDSHTFQFTWTAPGEDLGPLTFYCAGNAANGNGLKTGDYIYTTSQEVAPAPAGLTQQNAEKSIAISIYPNPVTELVNVDFTLASAALVSARITSTDGKFVQEVLHDAMNAGEQHHVVPVEHLSQGVYILTLVVNGVEMPGKLFRR